MFASLLFHWVLLFLHICGSIMQSMVHGLTVPHNDSSEVEGSQTLLSLFFCYLGTSEPVISGVSICFT